MEEPSQHVRSDSVFASQNPQICWTNVRCPALICRLGILTHKVNAWKPKHIELKMPWIIPKQNHLKRCFTASQVYLWNYNYVLTRLIMCFNRLILQKVIYKSPLINFQFIMKKKEANMFTMIFCWKHFLWLLSGLILIQKTAAIQVSMQVILKYCKMTLIKTVQLH